MKKRVRKSGSKSLAIGLNSIRNNKGAANLSIGEKIIDNSRSVPEYGTIVERIKSDVSNSVYLVRWPDGYKTLFEVMRDNLVN
jgi:hypothetical protein